MHVWCQERCGPDEFVISSRVDRAPDGSPIDIMLVTSATRARRGRSQLSLAYCSKAGLGSRYPSCADGH